MHKENTCILSTSSLTKGNSSGEKTANSFQSKHVKIVPIFAICYKEATIHFLCNMQILHGKKTDAMTSSGKEKSQSLQIPVCAFSTMDFLNGWYQFYNRELFVQSCMFYFRHKISSGKKKKTCSAGINKHRAEKRQTWKNPLAFSRLPLTSDHVFFSILQPLLGHQLPHFLLLS